LEALLAVLWLAKPEIFHSDQIDQYTNPKFMSLLKSLGIQISTDGRGRVHDNIFVDGCSERSSMRRPICPIIERFPKRGPI